MDLTKKLLVEPGSHVRLDEIDAGFNGHFSSREEADKAAEENAERIRVLQRKLYSDGRHALLIVLQGIDAAGKDGTCWHVINAMNPQGVRVHGFKEPTAIEKGHDFLWRVHAQAPARGQVAVFNRSHYEDVLVARVHKLVPKEVWHRRYDTINAFEELLRTEGDTTVVKFFLYISKDEQLKRFRKRLDDPHRQWKVSKSDYEDRELWPKYVSAFEDALSKCSTKHAPWYVIPSNKKWFRNYAIGHVIAEVMDGMHLSFPKPSVDLEEIRRLYHSDGHAPHSGHGPSSAERRA